MFDIKRERRGSGGMVGRDNSAMTKFCDPRSLPGLPVAPLASSSLDWRRKGGMGPCRIDLQRGASMELRILLPLILLATGASVIWGLVRALRTGRIPVFIHFGAESYSRRSEKTSFWIVVSWYVTLAIAVIYLAAEMMLKR